LLLANYQLCMPLRFNVHVDLLCKIRSYRAT